MTTKKKPAPKAKPKRKALSKNHKPKKRPAPKPPRSTLPDDVYFRINFIGGDPGYVYAADSTKEMADEIERRLKLLAQSKKIRAYHRGLLPISDSPKVVYEPRVPDEILKL